MYHVVMDHVFRVESIVMYHQTCQSIKHDFLVPYVEEGSFIPLVYKFTQELSNTIAFEFIFITICVPYIFRKFIFWCNYNHDTPLCDTPFDDMPLCDTPEDMQVQQLLPIKTQNDPPMHLTITSQLWFKSKMCWFPRFLTPYYLKQLKPAGKPTTNLSFS